MNIGITEQNLTIKGIRSIIKYALPRGRIVPPFKERGADMLSFVISGEVVYHFADGCSVTAHGGDVLYLPKGGVYYYDVLSEKYEYIYADLFFEFPEGCMGRGESFGQKGHSFAAKQLFEQMNLKWLTKPVGYYAECMSGLYQLYARLCQFSEAKYFSPSARQIPDKCAVYMQDHFFDPDFRITELDSVAGCSSAHLRRLFNDCFGMSPCDYLTHIRMENAKALLLNTEYSVAQIAEAVGYRDMYYFSRAFKRELGCSPTQYRASMVR